MSNFLGWASYDLPESNSEMIDWRVRRIENIRNGLISDAGREQIEQLIEELKEQFNYDYHADE
jgi:hypothetical protein